MGGLGNYEAVAGLVAKLKVRGRGRGVGRRSEEGREMANVGERG